MKYRFRYSANLFLKYVSLLSTQKPYLHDFDPHQFKFHLLKFQHPYSTSLFSIKWKYSNELTKGHISNVRLPNFISNLDHYFFNILISLNVLSHLQRFVANIIVLVITFKIFPLHYFSLTLNIDHLIYLSLSFSSLNIYNVCLSVHPFICLFIHLPGNLLVHPSIHH